VLGAGTVLCQALGITDAQYGLALDQPPFEIFARGRGIDVDVGPRIGSPRLVGTSWRYGSSKARASHAKQFKR
jgi:DNA-3-methyladenine glycosylase